jgi:hypothetical protein
VVRLEVLAGIEIVGIEENEALQRYFPDLEKGVVVNGVNPATPAAGSDLERRRHFEGG